MDMVFNELSVEPLVKCEEEAIHRVIQFIDTFKNRPSEIFNKIRFDVGANCSDIISQIQVSKDHTLADCRDILFSAKHTRIYAELLLSLARRPVFDDNSKEEYEYVSKTYSIIKEEKKIGVIGLASAHLNNTIGISFNSESFWKQYQFKLFIQNDSELIEDVFCVSSPAHFNEQAVIEWIRQNKLIQFLKDYDLNKHFPDFNFETKALNDIASWHGNMNIIIRIYRLLQDIKIHPRIGGLGKTEALKNKVNIYSKRIDQENRVVYFYSNNITTIIACKGHYEY